MRLVALKPVLSRLRRSIVAVALGISIVSGSLVAEAANLPNVIPLVMRTPHGGFNRMVVSVTLCEPGTARCATIDDVMIDTGSTGLRLEASAMPTWLSLPPLLGPGSRPLAECLRFIHDTAWGSLVQADVRLGGLTARRLPLQIIDDGGGPHPPACPTSNVRPTSNGTLGVGQHPFDCPGACLQRSAAPGTFLMDELGWRPLAGAVDEAYRLPNPVTRLPAHNNGIVIDLPSPPAGGTDNVRGTLTFGVGTADNNRLEAAWLVRLGADGRFTTVFDGKTFTASVIDSGTETYVLDDDRLPRCDRMAWAYCVKPRRQFGADMLGQRKSHAHVRFQIGDYETRRDRRVGASDDVAEAAQPRSATFIWGAPFFLGRRTFLVFEGGFVPGASDAVGPFYAVR